MDKEPGCLTYGLLGYPVKHSFSPPMHNAAFRALGINAQYKLFEVKPQDLSSFMGSLQQEGISGLNVTIPYKEKVLEFVELDREFLYLKQLRAVNTIVVGFGSLWGFNTDVPGFSRDLKENINPAGKKAAILGAGGASRAIAVMLAESGIKILTLPDIQEEKAIELAGDSSIAFDVILTDFIMPEMNGKVLVERIREIRPEVKYLYASGYSTDHAVLAEAAIAGGNFIQKPYDLKKLSEHLKRLLGTTKET